MTLCVGRSLRSSENSSPLLSIGRPLHFGAHERMLNKHLVFKAKLVEKIDCYLSNYQCGQKRFSSD